MKPKKSMMNKILLIAIILLGSLTACASTKTVRAKSTSTGELTLMADSIMFRSDVTRLYGKLIGMPHTSGRIDTMTLSTPDGRTVVSSDIDGVDMKRWFQWEDDGVIPVEIDFPPMKRPARATIVVTGPRGGSEWKITIAK